MKKLYYFRKATDNDSGNLNVEEQRQRLLKEKEAGRTIFSIYELMCMYEKELRSKSIKRGIENAKDSKIDDNND